MANDEYTPENDTSLEQNLGSETIYTPENDLSLTAELTSVPVLETSTAQATASGGQSQLLPNVFTLSTAQATASGQQLTVSGASTLETVETSATATGGSSQIDVTATETLEVPGSAQAAATGQTLTLLDTGVDIQTGASATATGSSNIALTPSVLIGQGASATATGETTRILNIPIDEGASATATGVETLIDVPGNQGEITVLIEGTRINTYTNIEAKKRLNEVDTFSFEAFIEDSSDRALIQEGNEVKIIENYSSLLFKGVLNEVEYKSNFRAKCEGNGMVQKLLDRKTNRDVYNNTAGDEIITGNNSLEGEVPENVITYGDIESAPNISLRFDHDNLARAVAGVSNATGYDWYIDQNEGDDFDTDYLNFVEDAGRDTVQETFDIGGNAQLVERNKDEGFVANDITLLGRGDGINQLETRVFAATTKFTDTSQIITENETGSFTVDDTSQLGSTGDNLLVRVGSEVMDVDITDGTTLSINSRGVNDYNGDSTEQIKHYENVRVWLAENVTTGEGRYTPDNPEAGSSIDSHGVKEQRDTDKTIVDISTLEKTADLELKNRFEDIFRVQIEPTDPRATQDLQLGDKVIAEDLTAMDVSDEFSIVGIDVQRNSANEGTTLHLANRPRRLTERLSEIESNTDTLNAHMQGATNFNGEHFEDNVDNTHPLNNKIFVPDDVVAINKFELTFARESFRGYVQNESHNHSVTVTHPSHSHTIDNIPEHDHDIDITFTGHTHNFPSVAAAEIEFTQQLKTLSTNSNDLGSGTGSVEFSGLSGNVDTQSVSSGSAGDADHQHGWPTSGSLPFSMTVDFSDSDLEHVHQWPDLLNTDGKVNTNIDFSYNNLSTTQSESAATSTETTGTINTTDTEETSQSALGTTETSTTDSAGDPVYGIFEPGSEPDIDVEVRVDGNLVTTVNNVSVGEEITSPIDLKPQLSEPLTGTYHDVELTPVDTGGGNNGRSRLAADITEKVFIESTL